MRARRLPIVFLAALAACGGPRSAGRRAGGDDDGAAYAAALAEFRAGRWDAAVAGFRAVLADDPDGDDAEAARYYLAMAQVSRGDCGAARVALGQLAARHGGGRLHREARDAVARCKPGVGAVASDPAAVRAELAAALAGGDGFHAALWGNRLVVAGGDPDAAERAAVEAGVDTLPGRQLDDLWQLLQPDAWPAPRVAFRRVLLAVHVSDAPRARELLATVEGDEALAAEARAEVEALEARQKVAPEIIGVLLPLSGRFAVVGKELRTAIELAAATDPTVKLVVVDTAGDEGRAAEAVDELVAKAHPILLLGPVGEREAAAAAARAAALGVPIALLTPADGLADPASGVFQLWSSGEDRARLAARAAVELGHDTLAVFAPRDDQGRAEARAFVEAAGAAGVEVTAIGDYDPTGTDLEPDVKRFLGLDPATNERLRKHLARHPRDGWKTFSPDILFSALYVPDGFERAALVAAFLTYFNVELRTSDDLDSLALAKKHRGRPPSFVQLFGSSGWHHPELVIRGGGLVEGAYVVDVFAGGQGERAASDGGADFIERFHARAGRDPSAIAAQAWDAALLALEARRRAALAGGGGPPRLRVAQALAAGSLEDGACGPARVGPTGELERGGVLLRVEGGEFVVQDPIE